MTTEEDDDAVDRLVISALGDEPDPSRVPALIAALSQAKSESSKRGAAVALARAASLDDVETVDALEDAYLQARVDVSLGPALLGTLGLLGLRCPTARATASAALLKLRLNESPYLLMAGAKMIGLFAGQRDEPDLRKKLRQLESSNDPGVLSEARYQLALLDLLDAFESRTRDELLTGLERARATFGDAASLEELRPDALLFQAIIELIHKFHGLSAESDIGPLIKWAETTRRLAGGVFLNNGSAAAAHLSNRILEITETLEGAAKEIVGASEWTNLHDAVELLAELHAALLARPAAFLSQERVEAAFSNIAEAFYRPKLGPILSLHVNRRRLARIIRDYAANSGQDEVYLGLRALEEAAHRAEEAGVFELSPRNREAMGALAARAGRSVDDLVNGMTLVTRLGESGGLASELGIELDEVSSSSVWRKALWEALRSAFTPASLERMLGLGLGVKLSEITSPGDFQHVVYNVITWAERHTCLKELVREAHNANPENEQLKRWAEEYGNSWN